MKATNKENKLVLEAQTLYKKSCYRESLKICETIYTTRPSNTDNLILLGAIHFQLRNLSESIFYSQQCLRVDPTCANAYVTIGNCMKETGEIDSAINFFHKAIRFQPRFPDAYNNLGCALFKLGKVQEAIEAFDVAISLDYSHCDALCNLANIYKVLRKPNDAKNYYLKAIQINPKCAVAWSNLGGIFNENRDYEQSLKCYEQALKIIPEFADVYSNMGNVLYNLGRKTKNKTMIDEAVSKYQRAQILRPDFAVATGNLAISYIHNNNTMMAKQLLRKATMQDPGFSDSLNNLSALYLELGEVDECIKVCLRVLKQKPDHYCAYHNLGNALKEKGILDAASYAFATANSIETNNAQSLCGLAAILLESGRAQESLDYLTAAKIDIDNENIPMINYNIGVAFTILQKKSEAEKKYLDQTLMRWKGKAKTLYNLSILSQRNGDIDSSKSYLQKLFATNDSRTKALALPMKQLLDTVMCVWSDVHHPWYTILQQRQIMKTIQKGDVFNHDECFNKNTIRIGYIFDARSDDSILKIPRRHDSSRFEVFEYSIHLQQTHGVAESIFQDRLHILVLLDKSPYAMFDDIFRRRPAPIQISFNDLVQDGVDFFVSGVSDPISPNKIHLKNAFIDNELYRTILLNRTSTNIHELRSKYCICEDSFVYASFSYPYEIDRITFMTWMKILKNTCESSILLLLRHNIDMEFNLKEEANRCGVNPERLLFINCTESNDHYEELFSLPDLFLDTITYSSGYPLCEALLSGTPVISIQNEKFSRFLPSIIKELELEDLVAITLEEYQKLAITLQYDEEKFISIVSSLDEKRSSEEGPYGSLKDSRWLSSYELILQSVLETKKK